MPQQSLFLRRSKTQQAAADLSCSSNKSLRPWQCPFKDVQGCRLPARKTRQTLPCSSQAPLRPRQTFPVAITILSAMISLSLYRTTPNRGVGGTRALAHSITQPETPHPASALTDDLLHGLVVGITSSTCTTVPSWWAARKPEREGKRTWVISGNLCSTCLKHAWNMLETWNHQSNHDQWDVFKGIH